ncbi:ATP-binding cassette domain-containing protein [Actinokineospora sp. G85]|uniref:ATP-binding cassette domain-containing protein n=1 Tax=Actinokineospora sp. G85 TaxID=3406626 RepID=UPI003C712363
MCVHLIDLTVGYADRVVLSGVTAHARRGGLTVLLGPAGVGKSTLLRTLADAQPALAGSVCVDGAYLDRLGPGERSRRVALGADGVTADAGLLLVDAQDAPVERLRALAVERDIAVVVASRTPPGELRAGDTVWLLGRDGVLRTGSPRTLADRIRDTFDLAPARPADRSWSPLPSPPRSATPSVLTLTVCRCRCSTGPVRCWPAPLTSWLNASRSARRGSPSRRSTSDLSLACGLPPWAASPPMVSFLTLTVSVSP